jgi:hypothetical protein
MTTPYGVDTSFQISGAYFTGLSNSTTLRVTAIFCIERVPFYALSDQPIVVVAKQPTPYDSAAIRYVIDASSILPPGCPQDENPRGEWWQKAVNVLETAWKVAEPIVDVFFPEVGMAAKALGTIGNFASDAIGNKGKKEMVKMLQTEGVTKKKVAALRPAIVRKAPVVKAPRAVPKGRGK